MTDDYSYALMTRKAKWIEAGDTLYMFARFHTITRVDQQSSVSRLYVERLGDWIDYDPNRHVLALKTEKVSEQERSEKIMLMTWKAKWVEVGDPLFMVGGFDTVTKIERRIPADGFPVLRFYLEDSDEWAEYDPEEYVLGMGDQTELTKRVGRNWKEQRERDRPLTN